MKRNRFEIAASPLWFVALMLSAPAGGAATVRAAEGVDQPAVAAAGDNVFAPNPAWQVHITMPASEYDAMQPRGRGGFPGFGPGAAPRPPEPAADPNRQLHRNAFGMDLPWATGTVAVGDQTFANVGIRYKGNGTIMDSSRSIKKSFKIDLDHFGGTAKFDGMKKINLHSGVADPSKCRETLAYGLYRAAGTPASRTALAEVRLTVPGKYDKELLGVYTVVEQVGGAFLRAHYGSDDGLLMKPEGLRDFEDWGDDWERYARQLDAQRDAAPDEAQRILAFVRLVNKADDDEFRREIASYLDVEAYLRFLAATAYVANSDSFFVLGHNYYMYLHPRTGQLHFIPWDLDRAFANFPILGSNSEQMDLSLRHPYAGTHRLTDRLLGIPEVSEKYQQLLKDLSAGCFDRERLLKEIDAVEAATKDLVARGAEAAEARGEGAGGGFGPPNMFGSPPDLKTFVAKRTESVAAQLAGTSPGHIPTGGFGRGGFGPGGFGPDRPGRPGRGPFQVGNMLANPLMKALDADQNDKLSKSEWTAAATKLFAACEPDAQDRADEQAVAEALNELLPPPPAGGPGGPGGPAFTPGNFMAPPIVKRADADNDGKLTADELEAAAVKLFDEFDKETTGALNEPAFGAMLTALFPPPDFGPPGGGRRGP